MPTQRAMFLVGTLPDGRPVYWADQRFDQVGIFVWQGDRHAFLGDPGAVHSGPMPIGTAPRDGSLFDMVRDGIRYTDCYCNSHGRVAREHGYPSVTTIFTEVGGATWTPRPSGLLAPYEENEAGTKYIP